MLSLQFKVPDLSSCTRSCQGHSVKRGWLVDESRLAISYSAGQGVAQGILGSERVGRLLEIQVGRTHQHIRARANTHVTRRKVNPSFGPRWGAQMGSTHRHIQIQAALAFVALYCIG